MPTTPEVLSDLHQRKALELANERRPPRLERTADKTGEIEGLGLFERPEERHYRFGVVHDAESYLPLLDTFSSHRILYEVTRKRLFAAVARLIDEEFGGRVVEGIAASST
jgi:hypothetical protein